MVNSIEPCRGLPPASGHGVNMAAKEIVKSLTDVEPIANRWILDFYVSLALELFQNKKYTEFCAIRDVFENVLVRPFERTDVIQKKVQVLTFLSLINDGENLESALMLLEKMRQENAMPQDFENVRTSLKEMMVGLFIKNNEFDKAKRVLNKHFPKPMVGKKAIFMALIRQKSKMHEVIEQIDLQQFKENMVTFCRNLCPSNVPFLQKAATQLIDRTQDDMVDGSDEQDDTSSSSSPRIMTIEVEIVPCQHKIIQRARLEAAYKAVAAGIGERTFAQLEEEVEEEGQARREDFSLCLTPSPKRSTSQNSEQDVLFQRDSGSPMEASPADQPPQTDAVPQAQAGSLSKCPPVLKNRRLHTVARLVIEPDSQSSLQCTPASQELEADVRTEDPPQSSAIPTETDLQSQVRDDEATTPMQKDSPSLEELSADSEEESPESVTNRDISKTKSHNKSNSSLRRDPDATCVTDPSLDSSPTLSPLRSPGPQTTSTPHKDAAQDRGPSCSKWKQLFNAAKESRDTWSDEESYFSSGKKARASPDESTNSNSGHRKRRWTEIETNKLKEGVKKFGEGNWSKIKSYYSFKDRTNVNLKDRWRTMKKLNLV